MVLAPGARASHTAQHGVLQRPREPVLDSADYGGTALVSGADASRFAREATQDFEAVLWVPCQGRTLAQAAGELGHQLGLTLDGPAKENCSRIRDLLAARRCLVVLDAASSEISAELTASGSQLRQ